MKKTTFLFTMAATATLLAGASASFGAVTYKDTGTTGLNVSTATNPDALDDINFATGTTAIRQELTGMTLGYGILPGTTAQVADIFVDFYSGLNMASTGAVNPTFIGGFGGTTNVAANTGTTTSFVATSFSGLNGLTTPINFTSDSIGVEIAFTDSTGMFYSTVITPLMTLSAPTTGTSVLGVYRDTNGDGTFQSTEFNATVGNLYLSLTTVANAVVPEPSTWTMMGLGLVAGAVAIRRRRLAV